MRTAHAKKSGAMLAAGGTAGHLFPAFALAQELVRRGIAVDLMTDARGDRYGGDFPARETHVVPSATFAGRSPVAALRTLATLAKGVRMAGRVLERSAPAAVIGFGGYPTIPPLIAARLKRIPTALHEQNAVLGRANRLLSRSVSAVATSFPATRLLAARTALKARFTGNPVRETVLQWAASAYRLPASTEPFRLLVFGGSQGARVFSDIVPPALIGLPDSLKRRLAVVQQCREEDLDRVRGAYAEAGIDARVAAFFDNLPELMASAQLVVGRAGASSVAELAVIGRPSILVPLPHALDNDQLQNATRLAEAGACWCVEQKELDPGRLAERVGHLMAQPERLATAAAAARSLGRPDAASRLADLVEELMGDRVSGVPAPRLASVAGGSGR